MIRRKNESDICELFKNFMAMSGGSKAENRDKSAVSPANEPAASLITAEERNILLERIANQIGVSEAKKLPYVSGLMKA